MNDLWNWGFVAEIWPNLLAGAGYTLLVTAVSFVLASIIGLPIAFMRNSPNGWIRRPTAFVSEFIRSTPILIQIFFVYFTLPSVGIVLPALATGIIVLSIHYATYISEAYRAGISHVSKGQIDAAKSLGLSPLKAFLLVILPQAIAPIVPALGNYLISLFKETPLLSAIAIIEILQRAKIIGAESFRYTEPITIVGLIFLFLSIASAFLIRRAERYFTRWR